MATDSEKIKMALDRLALFEQTVWSGDPPSQEACVDFIANMRLRLEHGTPGDTIACFATEAP